MEFTFFASFKIADFRARPPRGFFFQPQGSVSPATLVVAKIVNVLKVSFEFKNENTKTEKYISLFIVLSSLPYLSYAEI